MTANPRCHQACLSKPVSNRFVDPAADHTQVPSATAAYKEEPSSSNLRSEFIVNKAAEDCCSLMQSLFEEVSKRMKGPSFREEFVKVGGIKILCDALKQIQDEIILWENIEEQDDLSVFKSKLKDEYDCIVCIKIAAHYPECSRVLVQTDDTSCLRIICQSLLSPCTQAKIAVLDLLSGLIHQHPATALKLVLQQFSLIRMQYAQKERFSFLLNAGHSEPNKIGLLFKASLLGFMNEMLTACPNENYHIFLQTEFEESGLDIGKEEQNAMQLLARDRSLQDALDVVHQVTKWRKNYLLVESQSIKQRAGPNGGAGVNEASAHNVRHAESGIKDLTISAALREQDSSTEDDVTFPYPLRHGYRQQSDSTSSSSAISSIPTEFQVYHRPRSRPSSSHRDPLQTVYKAKSASSQNLNQRMAQRHSVEFDRWRRQRSTSQLSSSCILSADNDGDPVFSGEAERNVVYVVDGVSPAYKAVVDEVMSRFDKALEMLEE